MPTDPAAFVRPTPAMPGRREAHRTARHVDRPTDPRPNRGTADADDRSPGGDAASPDRPASAASARTAEAARDAETEAARVAARARRRRRAEGVDVRIVEGSRIDLFAAAHDGPGWDDLARAHRRGPQATLAWQRAWLDLHADERIGAARDVVRVGLARRDGRAVGMLAFAIEAGPAPSGLRIARPVGAWPLGPAPDAPTGGVGATAILPVLLRHLATVDEVDAVQLGPLPPDHPLLRAFDDLAEDRDSAAGDAPSLPGSLTLHHDRVVEAAAAMPRSAPRRAPRRAARRWRRLEREHGPVTITPLDEPLPLLGVLRAVGGLAPEDDGGRTVERVLRRLFEPADATPSLADTPSIELRGIVVEGPSGVLAAAACPVLERRGGPLLVARRRAAALPSGTDDDGRPGIWDGYGLGHLAAVRLVERLGSEGIDLDLGSGRVPWKVALGARPVPLRSVLLVRGTGESRARTGLALSIAELADLVGSGRWLPTTAAPSGRLGPVAALGALGDRIARQCAKGLAGVPGLSSLPPLPPIPEGIRRSRRRWIL